MTSTSNGLSTGNGVGIGNSEARRLRENYPPAYSDFCGCSMPCVFKSGTPWPVRQGIGTWPYIREVRPVYRAEKVEVWRSVGREISKYLDDVHIPWSFIDPLAYANAGEAEPFCPFIVVIGVKPLSVNFSLAVSAATVVEKLLHNAGFAGAEVAVVEKERKRFAARGPKLLSFNPPFDRVPELRRRFTSMLGLPIAPLKHDHYAGTGSLYLQLGGDDKRVFLLTCAHVARPPRVYPNTGSTFVNPSQPREEIISPGSGAFNDALVAMKTEIDGQHESIKVWNAFIARLGDYQLGEDATITETRTEHLSFVEGAKKKIDNVKNLFNLVQDRTDLNKRVIGFVRHSEPMKFSFGARGYTKDWAVVELYQEMIDWATFQGNKIFVAANISIPEYANIMWPQLADRADYQYPPNGLLQAYGIVQEQEMRSPQHLDVHNQKCLMVVKSGTTTGTTFGRVNGRESIAHSTSSDGVEGTSMELTVLSYDREHAPFSMAGDSGSIVLDRTGGIVGILTSGEGPTASTDVTYLTPYFDVHDQLVAKFPGIQLYPVVN